jgi:hypothetical protein
MYKGKGAPNVNRRNRSTQYKQALLVMRLRLVLLGSIHLVPEVVVDDRVEIVIASEECLA